MPNEILINFIFSFLLGALIGLERTYSKKQFYIGVRTCALLSALGFISYYISGSFPYFLIVISAILMIFYTLKVSENIGLTTIFATIFSFIIGYFVALGYKQEAIFITTLIVISLYLKEKLRNHLQKITKKDMEDFLEFIFLIGILYPFIPEKFTLFNIIIPIKEIYFLIIALSVLNFIAYILSKTLDPKKETYLISILGGLIDSTSSCFTLCKIIKDSNLLVIAVTLASVGMALRNFILAIILGYFNFKLIFILGVTLTITSIFLLLLNREFLENEKELIKIKKPFGVINATKVAFFIFIFIILLSYIKNYINDTNLQLFFLISSLISTTATTISLFSIVSDPIKFFPIVLIGGYLSNVLPLIYYKKQKETLIYLVFCVFLSIVLYLFSIFF